MYSAKNQRNVLLEIFLKSLGGKSAASYRNVRGKSREGAVVWLHSHEYLYDDRMPDNGDMMLPFLTRKKDIYDGSVTEKNKQLENPFHMPVCRAAFYEVWKTGLPKFK